MCISEIASRFHILYAEIASRNDFRDKVQRDRLTFSRNRLTYILRMPKSPHEYIFCRDRLAKYICRAQSPHFVFHRKRSTRDSKLKVNCRLRRIYLSSAIASPSFTVNIDKICTR